MPWHPYHNAHGSIALMICRRYRVDTSHLSDSQLPWHKIFLAAGDSQVLTIPTQMRPPKQALLSTNTSAPTQEKSSETDPGSGTREETRRPQRPRRVTAAAGPGPRHTPDALGRRLPNSSSNSRPGREELQPAATRKEAAGDMDIWSAAACLWLHLRRRGERGEPVGRDP